MRVCVCVYVCVYVCFRVRVCACVCTCVFVRRSVKAADNNAADLMVSKFSGLSGLSLINVQLVNVSKCVQSYVLCTCTCMFCKHMHMLACIMKACLSVLEFCACARNMGNQMCKIGVCGCLN